MRFLEAGPVVSSESESSARTNFLLLCLYACAYRELDYNSQLALHLVEVEGMGYEAAKVSFGFTRDEEMAKMVFRARRRIFKRIRGFF